VLANQVNDILQPIVPLVIVFQGVIINLFLFVVVDFLVFVFVSKKNSL